MLLVPSVAFNLTIAPSKPLPDIFCPSSRSFGFSFPRVCCIWKTISEKEGKKDLLRFAELLIWPLAGPLLCCFCSKLRRVSRFWSGSSFRSGLRRASFFWEHCSLFQRLFGATQRLSCDKGDFSSILNMFNIKQTENFVFIWQWALAHISKFHYLKPLGALHIHIYHIWTIFQWFLPAPVTSVEQGWVAEEWPRGQRERIWGWRGRGGGDRRRGHGSCPSSWLPALTTRLSSGWSSSTDIQPRIGPFIMRESKWCHLLEPLTPLEVTKKRSWQWWTEDLPVTISTLVWI